MNGLLIPNGKQQFIDSNGNPLASGTVNYYIPNTTTRKNTYQDDAQTILNTNPIVLDANGQCIAYGTGSYRQQVYDVNNNLIWDVNVDCPPNDASQLNYNEGGSNAINRTIQSKLEEFVSVKDFGAMGDGSTDDTTAIQNAINYAYNNGGRAIWIPSGTYITTKPLLVYGGHNYQNYATRIIGENVQSSIIKKTTTNTLNDGSTYASINAVLIHADYNQSASQDIYNFVITDMGISGFDTNSVAYGFYSKNPTGQNRFERCNFANTDITIQFAGDVFLSSFKSIFMIPQSKGFSMLASGTSNTLQNTFVYNPSVIGYELRGNYSAGSNLACDVATGTAYDFAFGQWTINGLGCESPNVTNVIVSQNSSQVNISSMFFETLSSSSAIALVVGGDSTLNISNSEIGYSYAPATAPGALYKVLESNGILTFNNTQIWDTYSTANTGAANITNSTHDGFTSVTGIRFPSTPISTSDPRTLNDYETGIWTPTIVSSGGGSVALTTTAQYTKVGRQVTVGFNAYNVNLSSLSTGSLTISGLPFANSALNQAVGYFNIVGTSGGANIPLQAIASDTTVMTLYKTVSANQDVSPLTVSNLASTSTIGFSFTYQTR